MADAAPPPPVLDQLPGPPPFSNGYALFTGPLDLQLQFFYRAPGDDVTPARAVCRTSLHPEMFVQMIEGYINRLDPVVNRHALARLTQALGRKLPDEESASFDDGEGN